MLEYNTARYEKSCSELVRVFQNQLTWKWDNRFNTVLAEFDIKDQESVQKIIKTQISSTWNDGNCVNAPEHVWKIVDHFRLNPGQQLFTTDTDKDNTLFCAWWPWSNGTIISIRIGISIDSLDDDDNKELIKLLRSWFSV